MITQNVCGRKCEKFRWFVCLQSIWKLRKFSVSDGLGLRHTCLRLTENRILSQPASTNILVLVTVFQPDSKNILVTVFQTSHHLHNDMYDPTTTLHSFYLLQFPLFLLHALFSRPFRFCNTALTLQIAAMTLCTIRKKQSSIKGPAYFA